MLNMEFNQRLQELRKQRGLTQEELAEALYVSRTAVSKWESGRGYPNIDSLKAVAKFFHVTIDELLSSDEALSIAEENTRQTERKYFDLVFGLIDLSAILLLFLPLFAEGGDGIVRSVSLISLSGLQPYIKITYLIFIALTAVLGATTLAMQSSPVAFWESIKLKLSLALGVVLVLIFTVTSHPYAAVFAFTLLLIKAIMLINKR